MKFRAGLLIVVAFATGCSSMNSEEFEVNRRSLTEADCVLQVTPSASVFEGPETMTYFPTELNQILLESPEEVFGFTVRYADDARVPRPGLAERQGTGFVKFSLREEQEIPNWAWAAVIVMDSDDRSTVQPGRYRAIIRYVPSRAFSGSQVCVAVSDPFEVRFVSLIVPGVSVDER